MDGSGRVAKRNRRHIQKLHPKNVPEPTITYNVDRSNAQTDNFMKNVTTTPNIVQPHSPSPSVLDDNIDYHEHKPQQILPQALRRSQRTSKAPMRYHDEFKL